MNLIEWKKPSNKPDALIKWLSKSSIVNGAKSPITVNDFFRTTTDNFLFPELNCLCEFFVFNFKIDISLRNKLIINSLTELITAKKETSDNLLDLIIDKSQHLILHNEIKCLVVSLSIKDISFRKIQIFDSEITFYKKLPTVFKTKHIATEAYKKCIIKSITSSNEIKEQMDNLNILRALFNFYSNSNWGLVMHKNPQPINAVRLGQFHTLHSDNGDVLNQYYEQKFISAPLVDLSKLSKRAIEKNLRLITECKYNDVIKNSLILYTNALDEWDLNLSLTILWNAIELLLSRKNKQESHLYKNRCAIIFPNKNYIGECLDSLRWIRNKYVHEYDNYDEARTLTYHLIYIYRALLAYHLSFLKNFETLDLAIDHLDSSYSNIQSQ